MSGIERIVNQLDTNQTKRIFKVPPVIGDDRWVKSFLSRVRSENAIYSVVIKEEKYTRLGISGMLNIDIRMLDRKFVRPGLLRPIDSDDFLYERGGSEPVCTRSLAQTKSWIYHKPIEKILLSESYFSSEEFLKKDPSERVRILFMSYRGCSWLEGFIKKQRAIIKRLGYIPKIKMWQRISRCDLGNLFVSTVFVSGSSENGMGYIKRLTEKGFILPLSGEEFKKRGGLNLVNLEALVTFMALVYDVDKKEIKIEDKSYINKVVSSFISNRLLPYIIKHDINPDFYYRLNKAKSLIDKQTCSRLRNPLYHTIRRGAINHTAFKNGRTKIRGIDLAIHALKSTHKYTFMQQDINELFGVDGVNSYELGMHLSGKGTYSRNHSVFPVYDMIAEKAREKFIREYNQKDTSIPLSLGNKTIYLSHKGKLCYCSFYSIPIFDELCIDQLNQQLSMASCKNSRIITPDLILTLKKDTITSVKIKGTNYR